MQDEARRWLTPEAGDLAERVAQVIDTAIGRADPATIKGAVNWGDLGCISVEFDTDGTVTALVSEASPDASELITHLVAALRAAGIGDVWVRTEW